MSQYSHIKDLHDACKQGNVEMVTALLENTEIFSHPIALKYALGDAIVNQHLSIVQLLLQKLVTVNSYYLTIACRENNMQMVELLIPFVIDINEKMIVTNSPLEICCKLGYLELVKLLIQHGADPSLNDNDALRHSNANNHPEIADYLTQLRMGKIKNARSVMEN